MFTITVTRPNKGFTKKMVAKVESAAAKAVKSTADYALERSRSYCPVDSGDLKSSGVVQPGIDETTKLVAFTMFYAGYVHRGTRHSWGIIPPNPFLTRGFADARRTFKEVAENAIRTALRG